MGQLPHQPCPHCNEQSWYGAGHVTNCPYDFGAQQVAELILQGLRDAVLEHAVDGGDEDPQLEVQLMLDGTVKLVVGDREFRIVVNRMN